MIFCVPYRAHFEHFEHKKFEPSELERNFFRAHTEPSENRAKFFSSISSTSALRAGKFSSEPSGFSSERCSYPTLGSYISVLKKRQKMCTALWICLFSIFSFSRLNSRMKEEDTNPLQTSCYNIYILP